MKNIVVCLDGTGNEISRRASNVLILYRALDGDRDDQVTYYDPGVGTFPASEVLSSVRRSVDQILVSTARSDSAPSERGG